MQGPVRGQDALTANGEVLEGGRLLLAAAPAARGPQLLQRLLEGLGRLLQLLMAARGQGGRRLQQLRRPDLSKDQNHPLPSQSEDEKGAGPSVTVRLPAEEARTAPRP